VDGRLDKRPTLFPFLVAICHHVFGYSIENGFFLNYLICLVSTLFFWQMLRLRFDTYLAAAAVLPLLWNPLWVQSMLSAGLTSLNLGLTFALGWGMLLVVRGGYGRVAEAFLIITAVLLAYARYESALWVLPVGIFLFLRGGGWRNYKPSLLVVLAPIFLVPALWTLRTSLARPGVFQEAGTESYPAFSLSYLCGNFQDSVRFVFDLSWVSPNVLFLTLTGLIGLGFGFARWLRRDQVEDSQPGQVLAVLCWLAGFALLYVIYQFYFWSSFRDVLAVRLSLVLVPPLIYGWALLLSELCARSKRPRAILVVLSLVAALLSIPNLQSLAALREANPLAELQNWKRAWVQTQGVDQNHTFFIDNHPQVWTAERYSAISYQKLAPRLMQLAYQMELGKFEAVYLVEIVRSEVRPVAGDAPLVWVPLVPKLRERLSLALEIAGEFVLSDTHRVYIRRVVGVSGVELPTSGLDEPNMAIWYLP
jgi:hypothetical protein